MTNEKICINDIIIEVQRKKVKNINLRVARDKSIIISANNKVKLKKIEDFAKSKMNWINESLDKIEKYSNKNIKKIEYVTGDEIKIQGKKYKIIVSEDDKNVAIIQGEFVYLFTSNTLDKIMKERIIEKMIRNRAVQFFNKSLDKMLELTKPYGIDRPELKIRKMKSRWGTCNKNLKKITINLELAKFPEEYVEYVILHELVHFLVSAHNKSFYNYLSLLMPEWKMMKKALNEEYIH